MSGLRPDKAPAQQLMTMLWAEGQEGLYYGKIFASTRTLIERGLVESLGADMCAVKLTPAGRVEAARLMATEAGKAYMAEAEEEA